MMSVEVRDGAAGGGGIDRSPSNLHWKKEMTQIRKAARVLKDPGTTSSWWSARSPTKHHIKSGGGGGEGNVIGSSSDQILQVGTSGSTNNGNVPSNKGNPNEGEKERRVYLCNWRNQKSESEMSRLIGEDDVDNGEDEGSSSTLEESFEIDSLNGGRNDSKSDGYFSDIFTAAIFKCMESSFTPSICGTRRKKSKRSNYPSPSSGHREENLQMKKLLSRYTKNVVESPSVAFGRDELLSLIDQSDDNGDYCNSEDLGRDSRISHLLARLKNKGWSGMRSRRREDDSVSYSTQALSTSSYNRYAMRNASTVESWDGTTGSLMNDGDDEVDDRFDLPGQQGCGIPCYWSRNGSSCSPSFSDVLRRKGSSLFCGSRTMSRRRHHRISLGANKRRISSKAAAQSLVPLLDNSVDGLGGSSMRSRDSDDELSANFSRLVGRGWSSSCRSQEGLELVALNEEVHKECSLENIKSLSHKYRPVFFEELIGQNIVVQSLMSAVSRGRISPVYLFHGLRGVGKTSMARIFAAAMNCLATEDSKPCGVCRECADFISGKSRFLEEVDGSNKKGVDQLKSLLRNISVVHPSSLPHYKVIVIEQCHLLPSKTWLSFLRLLDKPLPFVVFILITTDIDNVPRAILTRCQKHIFNKIGNGDIVTRLRKISIDENLDVESNALELIASNADGSLRDAEIMLDQLSLFGKQITKSLVNELMGVVSEDKLLELLELAMSSNATETVRRSREVMDSGVDPLVLISQLVTLIVDVIAGTYLSVDAKHNGSLFGGRTLTERELDRLKHALTLLSEAEKHLRVSSERSTWFTATLLQLGCMSSPDRTQSTSSRQQTSKATKENRVNMSRESTAREHNSGEQFAPEKSGSPTSFMVADHCFSTSKEKLAGLTPKTNQSQFIDGKSSTVSHDDCASRRTTLTCVDSEMLSSIWLICIEKCHSKTLRLLLHSYGKLVSISEMKGRFIADIAFEDRNIKSRAECFLSSITNSFEVVLRRKVEVKISLLQDSLDDKLISRIPINLGNKSTCLNATGGNSDLDSGQDPLKISRESFDVSDVSGGHQKKSMESVSANASISKEDSKSGLPLRRAESIINEQGSETGRLQALDKGTPASMSHSRPERNQVLPQDGMDHPSELEATLSLDVPLQNWGDELNHEMKTLKMNDRRAHQEDQIVKKIDHCPISPSLLRNSTFANSFSKDNMGYESGSGAGGCTGMFCWNNRRPHVRGKSGGGGGGAGVGVSGSGTMMSVEVRDGGGIDPRPSNLHLKKELTQIRKAARVLRDPGTSSSWRSPPLGSARSLTKLHYKNEKERRKVYLYNWRNQKSGSERSRQIGEDDVENGKDEGSSSTREESLETDSLNVGGNDSKSDGYLSDRYGLSMSKCKDSNFTPSIRRTIKKKSKRSNYSSASSRHQKEKLQMRMILSRYAKNVADCSPGVRLGRDNLVNLVDQSDDNGDYCNSEDIGRESAISPLLARLKNKGWSHSPTKLLRSQRKEDDSVSYSTQPLSTSSYNRYAIRNPSTVESWDATTGSLNGADDEVDDQLDLPGRQGCGIPCYWSRRSTPKSRNGSSCSPSLSDALRRKGSSLFCGSQPMSHRRHHRLSLGSNKRRFSSKAAGQSLMPLLDNGADGLGRLSMRSGNSDDELSTNFAELDLEALSRLDGRRWSSSCRSQEGLELVAMNGDVREEGSPENTRSLSHKYRPMFFEELIGQNIVVQSLTSAASRGRIAPVYLFQGARGIGKTSAARIFAAALNCLATEESKPCGICRECADFISGKSRYLEEVNGSNKKGINQLKNLLRNISVVHPLALPHYKIFVIDQCHLLPSRTWLTFLRLLDKPLPRVVFVLITTDVDNVPRTILTRCQKHLFNKISNGDIVTRLKKISIDENLDVESNALELIASNADGSLRDAETMLDQLSLFGKRITKSLVNELMGVVSEDRLLDLLELAMSSNATETVRRARELMDSGVDPLVLISQLVTLIVDIIAGTYPNADAKRNYTLFGGRTLTERELDRLKHALTLLSEAEKHLRVSTERSTWFTATLLQLGSMSSPDRTQSTSSRRQSSKATEEDHISMPREATVHKQNSDAQFAPERSGSPSSFMVATHCNSTSKEKQVRLTAKPNQSQFVGAENLTASHGDCTPGKTTLTCMDSKMLINIWLQCIEKCHSKTLRQLLHSYGKLVSLSEMKGGFIAHIAFEDSNIKTRAEGFLSSITNVFEVVLRSNVEVKISLLRDWKVRSSFADISTSEDGKPDLPLRRIESIIHEQRLETAWLQAMDKGATGSLSHLKPERNQVLPQDGIDHPNELKSKDSLDVPLQHWEDELHHEIKVLKINDGMAHQKGQIVKKADHYPISPSLLHNTSFPENFTKDNMGYESSSGAGGCSGLFCWNNRRTHGRRKGIQGAPPARPPKGGRFSLFGECAKSRRTEHGFSR
ncbi:AAA-type ATPase family protein [Perilla frutescens var. frutescens]|nr:AAA-type ATPase family protein [Perilla frutescens var. frutescens]